MLALPRLLSLPLVLRRLAPLQTSHIRVSRTHHPSIGYSHWRSWSSAAMEVDQVAKEMRTKELDDPKLHKEAANKPSSGGVADLIIPHLLKLYGSCATAQDFEIYAPDASFEDPLMSAHGMQQIKSAFYSIPKVFSESKIVEYDLQENIIAPGKVEVLINNKQHYKIFGKDVDLESLIRLQVEGGKIVRHEDWWDKKPLKNRDSVKLPLIGRLAEITRRSSMLATHALMGFGKDPSH